MSSVRKLVAMGEWGKRKGTDRRLETLESTGQRLLSVLAFDLSRFRCIGKSSFQRVWTVGKMRLLSPVYLHDLV